jgi:hypothetical protein
MTESPFDPLLRNPGLDAMILKNAEMLPSDDGQSNGAVCQLVRTCVLNYWLAECGGMAIAYPEECYE